MMARHYRSIAAAAEGGEKSQSREEKLLISRDILLFEYNDLL